MIPKNLSSLTSKISQAEHLKKAHLHPGVACGIPVTAQFLGVKWYKTFPPERAESPVPVPMPTPFQCCAAWLSRVRCGPASGSTAKWCSQPPALSQRVETQACLARNLAPVVPRMAVGPLSHCVSDLACRLGLASLLPRVWVRPGRDHGASWFPRGLEAISGKPMPTSSGHRSQPFEERPTMVQFLVTSENPLTPQKGKSQIYHKWGKVLDLNSWNLLAKHLSIGPQKMKRMSLRVRQTSLVQTFSQVN